MTFSNGRLSNRDRGMGHKIEQRNFSYPLTYRILLTFSSARFCTALNVTNGADGWSLRSLVAMA
jgi:hypothetical protein